MILSGNILTDLNECNDVDVPAVQNDIYSFQDPSVDRAGFIADLNNQFDLLYGRNEIMGAETPYSVPLTPDICLQQMDISTLVMDITTNER